MANNIDLSGAIQSANFTFDDNSGVPEAVYSVGGRADVTVPDVGNVIGTNHGDQIAVELGAGSYQLTFQAGSGNDTLMIGGRGNYDLTGITGVENYIFGNNNITMPDSIFIGVASGDINVSLIPGTLLGDPNFDASAVTAGHRLFVNILLTSFPTIIGGAGDDVFSGNLLDGGGLVLHGGGGRDAVYVTSSAAGMGPLGNLAPLARIDGITFFQLASDHADYNTITSANFVGVSGGQITAALGALGGEIDASTLNSTENAWLIGAGVTSALDGGAGDNVFQFAPGQLTAADTVVGGSGTNTLLAAGNAAIAVNGVSRVDFYSISGGGTMSFSDANFAGVAGSIGVSMNGGGVFDGSAVSAGHDLFLIGSPVTLLGGAGNDVFSFAANQLTAADTVVGGGGADVLLLTSPGVINVAGVSGVGFYELASGGPNDLAISNANVAGLATLGVQAGSGGDRLDASAVTSTSTEIYLFGDGGGETLIAGSGAEVLVSNGGTNTLVGGGGPGAFVLSPNGVSTVENYVSGTDLVFLRHSLFDLGASDSSGSDFQRIDPSAFSSAPDGSFTTPGQRFSFDVATHELLYAPQGDMTSPPNIHIIAVLDAVSSFSANDLFFGQ